MNVKVFKNGYLEENCYLVYKETDGLIIDPGMQINELEQYIKDNHLNIAAILVTHYHFDHIGALEYYKNLYNTNVIDYKNSFITNFNFEIINFFGHTLDSCVFYFKDEKIMFTGDFLFKKTIGNFEEENKKYMIESLGRIKKYPTDILVYPGHGDKTTLKYELINNDYLKEDLL